MGDSQQDTNADTLYLMCHGDSRQDDVRRYIGQTDLPLNEMGIEQARYWQGKLSSVPFYRIYCSNLVRSLETARSIAQDREISVRPLPELREINLGAWERLSVTQVRQRFPGEYERRGENFPGYRPRNGESFSDLSRRVLPVFERIVGEMEGNVLIVGHAGVNRTILCHVLGMPLANLFRLEQQPGSLSIIVRKGTTFRLRGINILPRAQENNIQV
jgi:probable phosphoglycerate mutase